MTCEPGSPGTARPPWLPGSPRCGPGTRALAWPALALAGVALLSQPWHGHINPAGLGLAGLAAIGWAAYILLIQRIGDRFTGIQGLSLTVPIAAATAALPGITQAAGHLTVVALPAAAGLALLLPVLPYAFEMLALTGRPPASPAPAADSWHGPGRELPDGTHGRLALSTGSSAGAGAPAGIGGGLAVPRLRPARFSLPP